MNLWSKIKLLSGRYVKEQDKIVERKYRFTREKYYVNIPEFDICAEVYKIKATRDFMLANGEIVRKGTFGGWLTSESALSHAGNCWVDQESKIIESRVSEDAYVENSIIFYNSKVSGRSCVVNSQVGWDSNICGSILLKATNLQNVKLSGNVIIALSNLSYATVLGDVELFDSTVENVMIHYEKRQNKTDPSPFSMNRVELVCGNLWRADNWIDAHCKWEDVKLSPHSIRISALSRMKSVAGGDKSLLNLNSPTQISNVEFNADTNLHTEGKSSLILGEDRFHPIKISGDLFLKGESVLKGKTRLDGVWELTDSTVSDHAELKSVMNIPIVLIDSKLDGFSSLVIEEIPHVEEESIELKKINLTDEDRYTIDANTYVY